MTRTTTNWLSSLDDERRERVHSRMRELHEKACKADDEARRLSPRPGELAVGSAAFDFVLRAECLHAVLGGVRRGLTPFDACAAAKRSARGLIAHHNKKRPGDINWPRDAGAGDSTIEMAGTALETA